MPKYKIDMDWGGKRYLTRTKVVQAVDACDALDWATPGMWTEGDFEYCDISIVRIDATSDVTD